MPDGFQFSIKGSRYVVTRPKLADAGEGIGNFPAQGLAALGPKLGPILWTLAARRKFDREDIAAFLKLLPAKHNGVPLRHVIEPRHETFRDEGFLQVCAATMTWQSSMATTTSSRWSTPIRPARYARLQRMREE